LPALHGPVQGRQIRPAKRAHGDDTGNQIGPFAVVQTPVTPPLLRNGWQACAQFPHEFFHARPDLLLQLCGGILRFHRREDNPARALNKLDDVIGPFCILAGNSRQRSPSEFGSRPEIAQRHAAPIATGRIAHRLENTTFTLAREQQMQSGINIVLGEPAWRAYGRESHHRAPQVRVAPGENSTGATGQRRAVRHDGIAQIIHRFPKAVHGRERCGIAAECPPHLRLAWAGHNGKDARVVTK